MFYLLISFLLAAGTFFTAYVIWYTVRGRRGKASRGGDKNNSAKEENGGKKLPWGVPKDAYCYPAINDVMGYEFIHVVKVGDELKEDNRTEKEKTEDIIKHQIMPGMTAVGVTAVNTEESEGEEIPDDYSPENKISTRRNRPTSPVRDDRKANADDEQAEEPEVEKINIEQKDLDYLATMSSEIGWWPTDEEEYVEGQDEAFNLINGHHLSMDDRIDEIINNNADKIEMPGNNQKDEQENAVLKEEKDAVRMALEKIAEMDEDEIQRMANQLLGDI